MAPSRFVFLDCLPLTSSGKVDRRQLSQIRIPTLSLDVPSHAGSVLDTVRAIWGRVLGTDIIEPDDDFFDVGGDSLLATWMVTELSQSLGHTIELSVFLSDSTLSGLVRTLEGLDPYSVRKRRVSELVTLRPGPPQRVLYFVHPLGGELLAYRDLATAIRSPLRVLGLRWQPEESWPPLSLSLEQMAEFHVLHLRSIQAAGPFLLAGWSFGGALAYEIAQQIVAAGERVDFLGLLDANPVRDPLTGVLTREIGAVDSLSRLLDRLNRDLSESEEAEVLDAIRADSYLSSLLGTAIPEGVTATHLRRNLLIARDSIFAAINYRPVPYTGAVDLFQAEETSSAIRGSLEIELRRLARGPFRLHTVPGSHYSMLRAPLVESLAQSLDRAVQQISAH
jgi:thioesterase domain-containing protein/acyl carrier protein